MKKIVSLALALLLAVSLCSCGTPSGGRQDAQPAINVTVKSFEEYRKTVLGAVDRASEMEALFPADGDLARMSRSRAAALIGLFNELNPENQAHLYRIHGQEALDALKKNGVLTGEEAAAMDAGSFYEAVDDRELAAVMKYFYGAETAEALNWDDPTRIRTAGGISFFKGGSAALASPILASLSGDDESMEFQAVTYSKEAEVLTDAVSGYPVAYEADSASSFADLLSAAGLKPGDVGAVKLTLASDGESVWIKSCSRRHGGCYVVTASPNLRVRTTNSTKGKVLGSLANGLRVEVLEIRDGWGRVSYDGKEGWISLEYADLVRPAAG